MGNEEIIANLTSTKELGRANSYYLSLSKSYPTAQFAVITQTINPDWISINYNGFSGTDNSEVVITYNNWFDSTLSGSIYVSIFGY